MGGWLDQVEIRLAQLSTGLKVEAELSNMVKTDENLFKGEIWKPSQNDRTRLIILYLNAYQFCTIFLLIFTRRRLLAC